MPLVLDAVVAISAINAAAGMTVAAHVEHVSAVSAALAGKACCQIWLLLNPFRAPENGADDHTWFLAALELFDEVGQRHVLVLRCCCEGCEKERQRDYGDHRQAGGHRHT